MKCYLICYVFLIVGFANATKNVKRESGSKPVFQFTYGTGKNQQSFVYTSDQESSATNSNYKTAPLSDKFERGIAASDPRPKAVHPQSQLKTRLISESEFLDLYQNAQKHDAIQVVEPPRTNGFYRKTAEHPLSGSSLETELEKLVNANVNRYNTNAEVQKHRPYTLQPNQYLEQKQKLAPSSSSAPQYQSPVVLNSPNDIIYVPYQQAQHPHQPQPQPPPQPQQYQLPIYYEQPKETGKAKIAYIAQENPARAPYPSDALEYDAAPKIHSSYAPSKTQESFKDLYLQQQQQNHLKRYQPPSSQSQEDTQSPPRSLIYVSQKTHEDYPTRPRTTQPETILPGQDSKVDIAKVAEQLFKTPLEEQKPLTQAEFQALIAAGYPVQAVPVPVVVSDDRIRSQPAPSSPQPQTTYKQPQTVYSQPPSTYSQPQTTYSQQAPQSSSPKQLSEQKIASALENDEESGFTYQLLPGENEQIATEILRQRVIQGIHHKQLQPQQQQQPQPQIPLAYYQPQPSAQQPQQKAQYQPQSSPQAHYQLREQPVPNY